MPRSLAASDLVDAGCEVFFLCDDDEVRAKRKEFGLLPGSTRCGDADGAFRSCNLDGSDADAAARSGDQDEIALGELALLDERAVGSEVLHPDAGSLLEGK